MKKNNNKKIYGMDRELFIQFAFCRAYEIEFNADEYHRMDNFDYSNDDNYCCLQDVVDDEEINKKIDECADDIRKFINNL